MSDAASHPSFDAQAYERYRPTYPDAVYKVINRRLIAPRNLCVELGAGSGKATRHLLNHFQNVYAVDPDPKMLAHQVAHPRLTLFNQAAEQVQFDHNSVDAVVCATSFHWMEQDVVLAHAYDWLRSGGLFYAFLYGPMQVQGEAARVQHSLKQRIGSYRNKRLGARADYSNALGSCGLFDLIETHTFSVVLNVSPAVAAGMILTTSFATAYLRTHNCREELQIELENDFEVSGNVISIRVPMGGISAIRP